MITPPTVKTGEEAVQRAYRYANHGIYMLGTGDSDYSGGASDCAGYAINYCWGLKRHQPGFNVGSWATISDDINTDSAIEDCEHGQQLFQFADYPKRGDLLIYKTIHLAGHRPWIGHVGIITNVPTGWIWQSGNYHRLGVIQCRGPNGARPGIICSDGSVWDHHDSNWRIDQASGAVMHEREVKIVRVRR